MEIRCGLFPCNANFCHIKRKGKKCRWCERTDMIEDENHILLTCPKSPMVNYEYNFREIVFENENWNPEILGEFIKRMFEYKNILKTRNERF